MKRAVSVFFAMVLACGLLGALPSLAFAEADETSTVELVAEAPDEPGADALGTETPSEPNAEEPVVKGSEENPLPEPLELAPMAIMWHVSDELDLIEALDEMKSGDVIQMNNSFSASIIIEVPTSKGANNIAIDMGGHTLTLTNPHGGIIVRAFGNLTIMSGGTLVGNNVLQTHGNNSNLSVLADIISTGYGISAVGFSNVSYTGSITATGADAIGAYADLEAIIVIDGTITARNYVQVGPKIMAREDGKESLRMGGYLEYSYQDESFIFVRKALTTELEDTPVTDDTTSKLPATGDTTNLATLAILLVFSLLGASTVFISRRRIHKQVL